MENGDENAWLSAYLTGLYILRIFIIAIAIDSSSNNTTNSRSITNITVSRVYFKHLQAF